MNSNGYLDAKHRIGRSSFYQRKLIELLLDMDFTYDLNNQPNNGLYFDYCDPNKEISVLVCVDDCVIKHKTLDCHILIDKISDIEIILKQLLNNGGDRDG